MTFKKRTLEEASKTFDFRYSKPLSNTLKKVGNKLPGALGGNALNNMSRGISMNRSELATSMKNARKEGNIGKATASAMSELNSPYVGAQDSKQFKSLQKGSLTRGAMSDDSIYKAIDSNPGFIRGSKISTTEKLGNKLGRGIKNTVVPTISNTAVNTFNSLNKGFDNASIHAGVVAQKGINSLTSNLSDRLNNSSMYNTLLSKLGQRTSSPFDKYITPLNTETNVGRPLKTNVLDPGMVKTLQNQLKGL